MDHFTSNQALNLLWVDECDKEVDLGLTREERKHLQLIVIDEFDFIDSAYKRHLISQDKLVILDRMTHNEKLFKPTV